MPHHRVTIRELQRRADEDRRELGQACVELKTSVKKVGRPDEPAPSLWARLFPGSRRPQIGDSPLAESMMRGLPRPAWSAWPQRVAEWWPHANLLIRALRTYRRWRGR